MIVTPEVAALIFQRDDARAKNAELAKALKGAVWFIKNCRNDYTDPLAPDVDDVIRDLEAALEKYESREA
jgi:hypothetical protein